jgi:excisionase family DNA binding protein
MAIRDRSGPDKTIIENQLLKYRQAAQYLGISESYLRRLKRMGKIKFVQVGKRAVRFSLGSLKAWIAREEIG